MKDKKQTLSVMKVTKELCCLSFCQTTVCMNSHICECVLRTFHNYASNNVCMCESIKKECAIRLPKYRFYSQRFCFFRSCILPCQLELVLVQLSGIASKEQDNNTIIVQQEILTQRMQQYCIPKNKTKSRLVVGSRDLDASPAANNRS